MRDVFLSYASEDKTITNRVRKVLENNKLDCRMPPRDIEPSPMYYNWIIKPLEDSRIFVFIYSTNSNKSKHAKIELERASKLNLPIIQFSVENAPSSEDIKPYLSDSKHLNATERPLKKSIERLSRIIKEKIEIIEKKENPATSSKKQNKKQKPTDSTIRFGIDLGNNKSCIARFDGNELEIIENSENNKFTPSVVAINKNGKFFVGNKAVRLLVRGEEGAYGEFRLNMGKDTDYFFPSLAHSLKPEELTAEILKSLRADVKQQTGQEISNAVITVPADFEAAQTEATMKAAKLAGFSHILLMQEPVAAAIAYGLDKEVDGSIWLIYDFGLGSFNAAIVSILDNQFRILAHASDNNLGGKLIDWEIVDKLLVPALKRKHKLSNFNQETFIWKSTFAKLKQKAEEAKIELSRHNSVEIFIENLGQDDTGQWIEFEYNVNRADLDSLMEPFIERSVNICRKAINDAKLTTDDIDKLIMVGGSTLSPILRDKIYQKLKIPLEFSIDAMTVLMRGAAIFANTEPAIVAEKDELKEFSESGPIKKELKPDAKIIKDSKTKEDWKIDKTLQKNLKTKNDLKIDEKIIIKNTKTSKDFNGPLVFISHCSEEGSNDKKAADAVCHSLELNGIKCWIAPRDILPGEEWDDAIVDALEHCMIMIVIFSDNVYDSYVKDEIVIAKNEKLEIITFRIQNTLPKRGLKLQLNKKHWYNAFSGPLDHHTNLLAKDVKKLIEQLNQKKKNRKFK